MKMHRQQLAPPALVSSASLKRQPSAEIPVAHGVVNPLKQAMRRHIKRTKPAAETSQPAQATQRTMRALTASPTKPPKGRVTATPSDRVSESGEQVRLRIQPTVSLQPSAPDYAPTFSGNFDLYGMYLPILAKLCIPQGATTPNYSAVYDRLLTSQAKHDYTARCFLPPTDTPSSVSPHGRFESRIVLDPMSERPFDIMLDSLTYQKSLAFTTTERLSLQAPEHSTPSPGLVGHTGLPLACRIKSTRGVFKIKRAWTSVKDGSVKELFEGFFSFSVCYDTVHRKAGHGNGAKYKFAFWGVRAMKDNAGKEIGLGPREIQLW